jgi:GMP synthase (glutamine-hydrolysing)
MRVLVLRHVPHEHLGTLARSLEENNINHQYQNLYEKGTQDIFIEGYDGLIILGGPMNVYEVNKYPFLEKEDRVIKEALHKEMPILGICLGAQLIAKALAAKIIKNKEKEIGWYPLNISREASSDKLFRHFNPEETVFQWHGDTFEIPDGAVHLAESPLCTNQAFKYKSNVYALQFHLEVTPQMISEWLEVPENKREIDSLEETIDPEHIRSQTPRFINRLNRLAENVFNEFCGLIGK